jgi:hypothetical protein
MDTKPYISLGFILVGAALLVIGLTWSHFGYKPGAGYSPIAQSELDRTYNERPAPPRMPPQELSNSTR